jgi:hypothetical protein
LENADDALKLGATDAPCYADYEYATFAAIGQQLAE